MQFHSLLLLSAGWNQFIQVFAALSLLILLHEFGHFFFARLFKTRVERFYLFFDFLFPFPGILNFSLFKKKKGDTEYGLGWFPLGGYVKIAGMVDESMDKEQMAKPPQPWEYRSKPAWQRLFIMLGGIIVNVLTAMIIYMVIFGVYGEDYLPTQNAKYGIAADSLAESIGLRDGDKILEVGGRQVENFATITGELILNEAKSIRVERNGAQELITIPEGTIGAIIKGKRTDFIDLRSPFLVGDVAKKSTADKMGLKEGDSITAINGQPIAFYDEFTDAKKPLAGKPVTLTVVREGSQIAQLTGTLDSTGKFGFQAEYGGERYFTYKNIDYNFGQAIVKGFNYTWERFGFYAKQLRLLFVSKEVKVSENIGGLLSFGKSAPPELHMKTFLVYMAFISIILAFMNLLPIPGLDGGYVFFLLWEIITRRKVSDKVMERATAVGLVLLLGLMLYANGMDVFREFIRK